MVDTKNINTHVEKYNAFKAGFVMTKKDLFWGTCGRYDLLNAQAFGKD